eukprot:scaffold418253_cov45-Prasinocladus_malaysianus.AAC.1
MLPDRSFNFGSLQFNLCNCASSEFSGRFERLVLLGVTCLVYAGKTAVVTAQIAAKVRWGRAAAAV